MEQSETLDIAIIGMSGRFPHADDLDTFWNNLKIGKDCFDDLKEKNASDSVTQKSVAEQQNFVGRYNFVNDIDHFDAEFFGFTPNEAAITDPQLRICLECCYHALEDAGYAGADSDKRTGVFIGIGESRYFLNRLHLADELLKTFNINEIMFGNSRDFFAGKIAFKLGLTGPSVNINTSCSSSLVAVHYGVSALLNYECDKAIVGGVFIDEEKGYSFHEGGVLSPDGICRAFDQSANGTVKGNGIGVVVLKRLEEALEDRDHIDAVIKGSAVNNDGNRKMNFTAPSVPGQANVIVDSLENAGIDASNISYLEAHGTGTALGDPIEIEAITKAYRLYTNDKQFCAIGTVKTNIGHLDTAAGIAGLIKTVLSLKHKQIPPILNFEEPNQKIDFENSPFFINTQLKHWHNDSGLPRRAAVSSFGIGGTNAHVILEEAPARTAHSTGRPWHNVVISAKNKSGFQKNSRNLLAYFKSNKSDSIDDIAYTLQVGRQPFSYRSGFACRSKAEAIEWLERQDHEPMSYVDPNETPSVCFMFPGQGVQTVDMFKGIYDSEPVFKRSMDAVGKIVLQEGGPDLMPVLFPSAHQTEPVADISRTDMAQIGLFAVEYSLAELLAGWGIKPDAMIGHSLGEYVAACLAGVWSLQDTVRIIIKRAGLIRTLPQGAMTAVSLGHNELVEFLDRHSNEIDCQIAAVNAERSCVISGQSKAIERSEQLLKNDGVFSQRLNTSHAFHSTMLDPILQDFKAFLSGIRFNRPAIPYVSNLTGNWVTESEATDPEYWVKHLRHTICFSDGLSTLMKNSRPILIEVGPGKSLTALAKNRDTDHQCKLIHLGRHRNETKSDQDYVLSAPAKLWQWGVDIDWKGFHENETRSRVSLANYAFNRQRYWIESKHTTTRQGSRNPGNQPSVAEEIDTWFSVPIWKQSIRFDSANHSVETWLVFVDPNGIGDKFAAYLRQNQQKVITVALGSNYRESGRDRFIINPRDLSGYDALFQSIYSNDGKVDCIAHFWNVSKPEETNICTDPNDINAYLYRGLKSLIFMFQAYMKRFNSNNLRIGAISNQVFNVLGNDNVQPIKATIVGGCFVLPQEHEEVNCCHFDIGAVSDDMPSNDFSKIARLIYQEFKSGFAVNSVAVRGSNRWVQEAKRYSIPPRNSNNIRSDGVFLLVGGLGGIGLELAEYFADRCRTVVITGKSEFPDETDWDRWLLNSPDDKISERIRRIQKMQKNGFQVVPFSVDSADSESMSWMVDHVQRRFGAINGIVNLAGSDKGGIIRIKTEEALDRALDAKVKGTLVLWNLFRDSAIDFFINFSSMDSFVGTPGLSAYCSSNAFQDALANSRVKFPACRPISINWGAWKETGMAYRAIGSHMKENRGGKFHKPAFLTKQGIEAFDRLINQDDMERFPQLVASKEMIPLTLEWDRLVKRKATQSIRQARSNRPRLQSAFEAPTNELEKEIAGIWEELLGYQGLGIKDSFFELGGDSLLISKYLVRLEQKFQIHVDIRKLFEYSTIQEICREIAELQLKNSIVSNTTDEDTVEFVF